MINALKTPEQVDQETLKQMISTRAIEVREAGFKLASGKFSKLYIDLRRIIQDPLGINLVGKLVLEKVIDLAPGARFVGGLETSSIPISTAVSLLSLKKKNQLSAFWVRKKEKDHGLGNRIEGNLEKDSKVVILEDTVTTGGSMLQAATAVREFGATVVQAIAIVDRGATGAFEEERIPFYAFFKESDFTDKAQNAS